MDDFLKNERLKTVKIRLMLKHVSQYNSVFFRGAPKKYRQRFILSILFK